MHECAQSVHIVFAVSSVCTGVHECAQANFGVHKYSLSTPNKEIRSKCAQFAQKVHKKCTKSTRSVTRCAQLVGGILQENSTD